MKNRFKVIVQASFIALVILTACSPATTVVTPLDPTTTMDAATLVQERCTVCHSLDRIQGARYSAAEWKVVVDRMISHGAQLTPQEETIVVDWLVANYGP